MATLMVMMVELVISGRSLEQLIESRSGSRDAMPGTSMHLE
jgi:hypothetical protein